CVYTRYSPCHSPYYPTSYLAFTHASPPALSTLSLHDALPISEDRRPQPLGDIPKPNGTPVGLISQDPIAVRGAKVPVEFEASTRSEEHTSELQSRFDLVCRLLLEKKKHSMQSRRTTTVSTSRD